jgi:acetyl-CoA synthetase
MLKDGYKETEDLKQDIFKSLESHLMTYSRPRYIEFIGKMPMTRVGKIAFRELEERERGKSQQS